MVAPPAGMVAQPAGIPEPGPAGTPSAPVGIPTPPPGSPAAPPPTGTATPILPSVATPPNGPAQAARPAGAPALGEESPLDIGWTGVVPGTASEYDATPTPVRCGTCGDGTYQDGYCNQCGAKEPNPRDHLEESASTWVGGVSDIGRRHARNEDALALSSRPDPASTAVLVVCDGVSNTTDSDVASLAACRAARTVLEQPLSAGMGVADAARAAAYRRLGEAVAAANTAVIATTTKDDPASPSCTFTGAIVAGRTAYVGNVGDSRIYWLPDGTEGARQLSVDDSVAAERIASGIERKVAETGPMAHSITRWLGIDAPDDLTPHTHSVDLAGPGWLMLCSDGLWNYCSDAKELQQLIGDILAKGTPAEPIALARALVGFANNAGGADNITVAFARIPEPNTTAAPEVATDLAGSGTTEGETDGTVHR